MINESQNWPSSDDNPFFFLIRRHGIKGISHNTEKPILVYFTRLVASEKCTSQSTFVIGIVRLSVLNGFGAPFFGMYGSLNFGHFVTGEVGWELDIERSTYLGLNENYLGKWKWFLTLCTYCTWGINKEISTERHNCKTQRRFKSRIVSYKTIPRGGNIDNVVTLIFNAAKAMSIFSFASFCRTLRKLLVLGRF